MIINDNKKTEQISILHMSDLHRSPQQSVSNDALLNSLETDLNRYSIEPIPISKPDLIIVGGDLVKGIEEGEPLEHIYLQYDEAADFLSRLAGILVNGEKERIIIVPGNHDVCWHYSRTSMKKIQMQEGGIVEDKRRLFRRLMEGDSDIRWAWNTFEFLRIEDEALYRKSFEPFANFYIKFYDDKRRFPLEPADQFDIFDYPDLNTTIVTFNSCYNNDHCNTVGRIHFDCISKAIRKLRAPQYFDRLLVAVWHHSVKGSPLEANYMDSRCLKNLIEAGFSICFHGHQHYTEVIEEYLSCITGDKSYFVSAGTLCGSRYDLPVGKSRQYNVVHINQTCLEATIHLREMKESCFELPIWGPGSLGVENKSCMSVKLQKNNIQIGREMTMGSYFKRMSEAERLIGNRDYKQALEILENLNSQDEVVRRFKLECYINLSDNKKIINLYYPPQTDTEIIYCLHALWEEGEVGKLQNLLGYDKVSHSDNRLIQEAQVKYSKKLRTKKAL